MQLTLDFFTNSATWWTIAIILVLLELFTGSFYLLILAVGAATAAILATIGIGLNLQILSAVITTMSIIFIWRIMRKKTKNKQTDKTDKLQNLDIGEIVYVEKWQEDGTAQVIYRGAKWIAIKQINGEINPEPTKTGRYKIIELIGTRLLISPV